MNRVEQPEPPQTLPFGIKDTTAVACECGHEVFIQGNMFRRVSRILTGTTKDALVPITVPVCASCKSPLQDLLPEELKKPKFTL
jgi:hypothetical protein